MAAAPRRGRPVSARRKALLCVSGLALAFSAPATAEWFHQHRGHTGGAQPAAFSVAPQAVLAAPTPAASAGHAGTVSTLRAAEAAEAPPLQRAQPLLLASSDELLRKFAARDVRLEDVRTGRAEVPAIFLVRFPADLPKLTSVKQRKQVFIKTVLPLILRTNQQIAADRRLLLRLLRSDSDGQGLSELEQDLLSRLGRRYGVDPQDRAELLQRIDIVPASLALAQGVEESGWGTSRFARLGNAVFGQRAFKGTGMVPQERAPGARFVVRAFEALETSVRAYVWNLNTHPAYGAFRAARAAMRDAGQPLDSHALAGALTRYSERGDAYVETIRTIMRGNGLQQFDDARLNYRDKTAANELGMRNVSGRDRS